MQYIKFNLDYEISRQATFLLQKFTSNKIKKATQPITPPRFSVSVCKDLLGLFSELFGLMLLHWSTNSHQPSNCLNRNTTATKTNLNEIDAFRLQLDMFRFIFLTQMPASHIPLVFGERLSLCPPELSAIISNRLPYKVSPKRH